MCGRAKGILSQEDKVYETVCYTSSMEKHLYNYSCHRSGCTQFQECLLSGIHVMFPSRRCRNVFMTGGTNMYMRNVEVVEIFTCNVGILLRNFGNMPLVPTPVSPFLLWKMSSFKNESLGRKWFLSLCCLQVKCCLWILWLCVEIGHVYIHVDTSVISTFITIKVYLHL